MSSSSNGKKKKKDTAAAEIKDEQQVDELLRAAEDDMLLKLSLNSHMARGFGSSSQFSGIDPDLESRFQALKKPHQPKSKPKSNLDAATTRIGSEKRDPDQSDDLCARFAALKGSLPSYSISSAAAAASAVGIGDISDQVQQQQVLMDDDNEEDEVEKVIKWAIDAARLDPSPPSDSEDDHTDDDHSEDEGYDTDDDRGVDAGKKSKRK